MEGAWKVHGRCKEGAWKVQGRCMEGAWKVHGRCKEGAWKVHGRCKEGAWKVHTYRAVSPSAHALPASSASRADPLGAPSSSFGMPRRM
jgi:hypothetical protein